MIAENESIPRLIADYGPEKIEQLVTDRLAGSNRVPILHASREEVPEDIVVWLLRNNIEAERRKAVVAACRKAGTEVINRIISEKPFDIDAFTQTERWANVLDRVAPDELKSVAKAVLQVAMDAQNVSPEVLDAIVRATLRFRLEETDADLWIQLLKREELCAYGFNALLQIDPQNPRIVRSLLELWENRKIKEWKVNAQVLTAKTIRAQGSNSKVKSGLQQMEDFKNELHGAIMAELRSSKIEILRVLAAEYEATIAMHSVVSTFEELFQETRRRSTTKHSRIHQFAYAVELGDQTAIRQTFVNPTGRFSSEELSDVRINNHSSIFQGPVVVDFEISDPVEHSHTNYFEGYESRKKQLV